MPDPADIHSLADSDDPATVERSVWFGTALLPSGWASGVRITWHAGVISSIHANVACTSDDERYAIGIPGLGNLHSHAFQRALAGLTAAAARAPRGR